MAGSLACGAAALVLATERETSVDATPVTAAIPPATVTGATGVAPTSAPASTTSTSSTAPAIPSSSSSTTLPLSPLHARLGAVASAVPAPVVADVAPTAISIEAIGVVGVPVRAVGLLPDGELEIPGADEVGWYRFGGAPGQPGSTVLAAHVSWNRRSGPFLRLAELEPGARIAVALADGGSRAYQVVARAQYDKRMLPAEVWRTSGPETLVLITCGGAFDSERRRYADNIVVTAVPAA